MPQSRLFELTKHWEKEHAAFSLRVRVARAVMAAPADAAVGIIAGEIEASGERLAAVRPELQLIERCGVVRGGTRARLKIVGPPPCSAQTRGPDLDPADGPQQQREPARATARAVRGGGVCARRGCGARAPRRAGAPHGAPAALPGRAVRAAAGQRRGAAGRDRGGGARRARAPVVLAARGVQLRSRWGDGTCAAQTYGNECALAAASRTVVQQAGF